MNEKPRQRGTKPAAHAKPHPPGGAVRPEAAGPGRGGGSFPAQTQSGPKGPREKDTCSQEIGMEKWNLLAHLHS
jgi:hypothetical protein